MLDEREEGVRTLCPRSQSEQFANFCPPVGGQDSRGYSTLLRMLDAVRTVDWKALERELHWLTNVVPTLRYRTDVPL